MTQPDRSDIERSFRWQEVATLIEHDTDIYVVSVMDADDRGGVVSAVFAVASDAVAYAHDTHMQLIEGEYLLIEGFELGVAFDPTTVRVERPDCITVEGEAVE